MITWTTTRGQRGVSSRLWCAVAALCLLAAPVAAQYESQGPAPLTGGQVEGITGGHVTGAVEAVAAHPTDADTLFAGSVNGGIWRTTNATTDPPTWAQVSDSGSISDIKYDLSDGTNMTLLAGVGRTSSFAGVGGDRTGLLRSTNGGATWSAISSLPNGPNVRGVAARGANLVAAISVADIFSCPNIGVFHSSNTGTSFTQRFSGRSFDVAENPMTTGASTTEMFTSIDGFGGFCQATALDGIYRTTDSGATWTKVSSAAMDAEISSGTLGFGGASNVAISVGRQGVAGSANVFVAICSGSSLSSLWRSGDSGATWSSMAAQIPTAGGGIHPGGQCSIHLSLQADPTNHDVVHIGGDRQASPFANTYGAFDFSGQVHRLDATGTLTHSLTHCSSTTPSSCSVVSTTSSSAPHADSRDMAFDANGNLIESDDGGVYRRTTPLGTGDWFSLIGNLAVNEQHDAAYDTISNSMITGNQDTGSGYRDGSLARAPTSWTSISTADGGDVAVGEGDPSATESTRYSSFQTLGAFRRTVWNSSNVLQSTVFPALTVTGGCAAMGTQFVHPLQVNQNDPTRIIFGGSNGVYESTNRGDTITGITGCGPQNADVITQGQAFVYGYPGQGGGTPNDDFLAYGRTSDNAICVRTAAPPAAPTCVIPTGITGDPVAVAVDPGNASRLVAVTSTQIFESTSGGTTWTDVTGSLLATAGQFHTATIIRNVAGTHVGLVIGARNGVFIDNDAATRAFGTYTALSSGLPKALVYELDYDPVDDRLLVGTMGAGAYTLDGVNALVPVELEWFSVE